MKLESFFKKRVGGTGPTRLPQDATVATVEDRRRVVREVYDLISPSEGDGSVTYSQIHQAIRTLQPRIKEVLGIDLGYGFTHRNLYGPWDPKLQNDLEILDARGLVNNHDEIEGVVATHKLSSTKLGRIHAKNLGRKDAPYVSDVTRSRLVRDRVHPTRNGHRGQNRA